MIGKILCAGVLSAALILLPNPNSGEHVNKMDSVAVRQQVQAEAPRKEPTGLITDVGKKSQEKALTEPEASMPETAVNVQTSVKASEPEPQVTSTCADEVKKYSWPQSVALQIVGAESSHNPTELNDNPSTGDYSIGCFQINLKGSSNLNAKYRDAVAAGYNGPKTVSGLERWLKDPKNNVAVAHIMWQGQKWKPWGKTTCAVKVRCY